MQFSTVLLALVPAVSAHFRLNYPFWRGDSLALAATNTSITQWNYPCAGIGQETSSQNRTAWPLDGGSVVFNSSHTSTLVSINLGLGDTVTGFNVSLVPTYNSSGAGVTCFSKLGQGKLAALGVRDGTTASVQVITLGDSGAALYNCADIVFRANATVLSGDACKNQTTGYKIGNVGAAQNGSSSNSSSSGSGSPNGAGRGIVPVAALFAAVGAGVYAAL